MKLNGPSRLLLAFSVLVANSILVPRTTTAFAQSEPYSRGPYLALATPHSMTVVWRTDKAIQPRVRIGVSPKRLLAPKSIIKVRTLGAGLESLAAAPPDTFQYEAQLMGLQPGRKYYYGVYDGDKLIAGGDDNHYFSTHPRPGSRKAYRFWVVGDSGTGDRHQAAVADSMRAHVVRQNRPLDFYVHVGDMAYSTGKDSEFQNNFFKPYQDILRNVVCWPSMGNHEGANSNGKTGVGPYYDAYVVPTRGESGGLPSGTEAYYSFDYANTHFICLNSHDLDREPTAAMARWLKADLEATRADWIVAFWHHPPYSKGTHDSDKETQLIEMRRHILPILESAGVDLVLTGHSHIYERSMLIDGAYGTPTVAENFVLDDGDGDPNGDGAYRKSAGLHPNEGAVQVVAGHGGAGLGRVGTVPIMKRIFVEHGSVIVDVDGDTLTAVMINLDGKQRDLFSIVKRGKVSPRRIANPKQPQPYYNFKTLARMALTGVPVPGTPTRVNLEIPALPDGTVMPGATARVEWSTAGTSWKIEPQSETFPLIAGQAVRQEFVLTNEQSLYPLPTGKIVYTIGKSEDEEPHDSEEPDGVVEARLGLTVPPYKKMPLKRLKTAPAIDGVLSETELAGLQPQSDFVLHSGAGLSKFPTEFYAGIFENQLYLAVINNEPDAKKIALTQREPDGQVYNDNSNEIFIQREGDNPHYQFIVNAAGSRFDARRTDAKWNSPWQSATKVGSNRWISELLIPLDSLGGPLKAGEKLRFNLVRNNVVQRESSQWSFTNRLGNHSPEYFGTLVVENN